MNKSYYRARAESPVGRGGRLRTSERRAGCRGLPRGHRGGEDQPERRARGQVPVADAAGPQPARASRSVTNAAEGRTSRAHSGGAASARRRTGYDGSAPNSRSSQCTPSTEGLLQRSRRRGGYSFGEMVTRSEQGAAHLAAHGVRAGDSVVVMLGNQVELWESMLALIRLGAVIMPTTTAAGPTEPADRLDRRAGPKAARTGCPGGSEPGWSPRRRTARRRLRRGDWRHRRGRRRAGPRSGSPRPWRSRVRRSRRSRAGILRARARLGGRAGDGVGHGLRTRRRRWAIAGSARWASSICVGAS